MRFLVEGGGPEEGDEGDEGGILWGWCVELKRARLRDMKVRLRERIWFSG